MRVAWRTAPPASSARRRDASIADFRRQLLGVLDPAAHRLLGGEELHQLALLVGLGHGLRETRRIAIFELAHGVDAGGADELGVVVAHALDAHAVGAVGPLQEPLLVN